MGKFDDGYKKGLKEALKVIHEMLDKLCVEEDDEAVQQVVFDSETNLHDDNSDTEDKDDENTKETQETAPKITK